MVGAARHAPFRRGEIGLLAASSCQRFSAAEQIQFGKDIAEPRDSIPCVLARAQRQQGHVGAQRERRRVARELAIESGRRSGVGRRGNTPRSSSGPRPGTASYAVTDMLPERLVKGVQALAWSASPSAFISSSK